MFSLYIFEKGNDSLGCLLHTSPVASMLGWFLYFTTHFKTGSLILLARGSQFEYSAIYDNVRKESIQNLAV